MATKEVSLGVYTFLRATKNTRRYEREDDEGRADSIYVRKAVASKLDDPETIEVIVRAADDQA